MKQRIYIDTSIVGGFFDKEFELETKALFERLRNKEIVFVVSDLLEEELIGAPDHVKKLLRQYEDDCFESVILTEDAKDLANSYAVNLKMGHAMLEIRNPKDLYYGSN
jgi:hypothetical protein